MLVKELIKTISATNSVDTFAQSVWDDVNAAMQAGSKGVLPGFASVVGIPASAVSFVTQAAAAA